MGPDRRYPPLYQMQGEHFRNDGFHPLAWLFILLVIALVVFAVYWAIRYMRRPLAQAAVAGGVPGQNVLAVVALRYANGEIDRDQYLRMSADLGGPTVPASPEPPPPE